MDPDLEYARRPRRSPLMSRGPADTAPTVDDSSRLEFLLIAFDEIRPFGPAVHPVVGDSDAVLVRLSIVLLVLDRLTVGGLTSWWRPY